MLSIEPTFWRDRFRASVLRLAGRKSFWTVFLDPVTAHIVATMPLDSF